VLDVAIVGGGVSGVYSGWRLMTCKPHRSDRLRRMAEARGDETLRVSVFEGSQRIGGRLLSVTPPGMPHIRCELGGMRYISSQSLVRSLVENKLGLPTRPFPVDEPQNLKYLRGRRLRNADLTNPDVAPYDLDWAERGHDPGSLIAYAIEQLFPGLTTMPPYQLRERLRTLEFEGKPISGWGFWNLLARGMSHEAYEYARQAGGYDTPFLNWNAADTLLLNFDLGPGVTFHALVGGYDRVPITLSQLFEKAGGTLQLGWWLASFDIARLPDGTDGVQLAFSTRDAKGQDVVQPPILARALVLAMPRRSLELLDRTGAVLRPENTEVHELIRSVTPIPLFKMAVCYRYPWWETVGVTQGRSITDLPLRQC
jgi:hypothetical protein